MVLGLTGKPQRKIFVVECKLCHRHIPAGVEKFPKDNIVVECALCGEKRRFRPNEVFMGMPSTMLDVQRKMDCERIRMNRRRRGLA